MIRKTKLMPPVHPVSSFFPTPDPSCNEALPSVSYHSEV
jgi:hypothetical protein